MRSVFFENCQIIHPDLEVADRVIPQDKKLSLHIQMDFHLIDMTAIEVLELDQAFYRANLDKFGKDMQNLKHLSIDHKSGTDIEIFKAVNKLPELVVLDCFRVYQKLPASCNKVYSLSRLI